MSHWFTYLYFDHINEILLKMALNTINLWKYEKKVYFVPLVLDYIIDYLNELHVLAKYWLVIQWIFWTKYIASVFWNILIFTVHCIRYNVFITIFYMVLLYLEIEFSKPKTKCKRSSIASTGSNILMFTEYSKLLIGYWTTYKKYWFLWPD